MKRSAKQSLPISRIKKLAQENEEFGRIEDAALSKMAAAAERFCADLVRKAYDVAKEGSSSDIKSENLIMKIKPEDILAVLQQDTLYTDLKDLVKPGAITKQRKVRRKQRKAVKAKSTSNAIEKVFGSAEREILRSTFADDLSDSLKLTNEDLAIDLVEESDDYD